MWIGLICFLAWSIKVHEESLEEMGLNLDEEKKEDLLDLGVMAMPGLGWFMNDDGLGDIIQGFLTRIITDESERADEPAALVDGYFGTISDLG